MKTFFKKFAGLLKKEIMLSVSLAVVIVSFFITFSPFSPPPILKAAQFLKSSIALAQFLGA